MLDLILIILTLAVLVSASYTDLKTREVPDWLNFSLIGGAFGVRAIFAVGSGWEILVSGILGFITAYIIAAAFYYTHQWGGGDSKFLMGMGAVIGISLPLSYTSFHLLWFLVGLLVLGAIYGLFYMVYLAIKGRHVFTKQFKIMLKDNKLIQRGVWILSLAFILLSIFSPSFRILSVIPVGLFYLFTFVTAVEESCFVKDIPLKRLTEGDWLAQDVKKGRKIILSTRTIIKKDLLKLHQHKVATVKIKEGVPFIPGFLLAYVMLLSLELIRNIFIP